MKRIILVLCLLICLSIPSLFIDVNSCFICKKEECNCLLFRDDPGGWY